MALTWIKMDCKICGKRIKKIHQNHCKSIRHQAALECIFTFKAITTELKYKYVNKVRRRYAFYRRNKKPKYRHTKFKFISLTELQYRSYVNKFKKYLMFLIPFFNYDLISLLFSFIPSPEVWINLLISSLTLDNELLQEELYFTQDLGFLTMIVDIQERIISAHNEYFEYCEKWHNYVITFNSAINAIIYPSYNFNIDISPKSKKRKWILFINKLCDLNMNVSSIIINYLWTVNNTPLPRLTNVLHKLCIASLSINDATFLYQRYKYKREWRILIHDIYGTWINLYDLDMHKLIQFLILIYNNIYNKNAIYVMNEFIRGHSLHFEAHKIN